MRSKWCGDPAAKCSLCEGNGHHGKYRRGIMLIEAVIADVWT